MFELWVLSRMRSRNRSGRRPGNKARC